MWVPMFICLGGWRRSLVLGKRGVEPLWPQMVLQGHMPFAVPHGSI